MKVPFTVALTMPVELDDANWIAELAKKCLVDLPGMASDDEVVAAYEYFFTRIVKAKKKLTKTSFKYCLKAFMKGEKS